MTLRKISVAMVLAALTSVVFGAQGNVDKLAEYYGFGDIEIIKLHRAIKELTIADFNGDGKNDIAVVDNLKSKIQLLVRLDQIRDGDEHRIVDVDDIDVNIFSARSYFDKQDVAVSQRVFSLAAGDLNSDGLLDLVFYGDPKGLYVVLQKGGQQGQDRGEKLLWRRRKRIDIADGLTTSKALVCADINNDGASDVVLAGRDAVYIVLQESDGTLAEAVKYPTTALPLAVKVGDADGDGINDLVLLTNDEDKPIHLRLGLETGHLGPQVEFFIEKPYSFKLYDIDGRVGDEIVTIDARSGRLMCYKLVSGGDEESDWPVHYYPLAAGEGSSRRDMEVGDIDGDGLDDVIISDPGAAELIFYRQISGLGLAEPVRFPTFSEIENLSVADIDGDGKMEVGVLSIKEKVIGKAEFANGRLSFPETLQIVGEPVGMELVDIDGDKHMDCVYISRDANDVRSLRVIYRLDRPSGKQRETKLELKALEANPEGLKIVDVDQDGLKDVLIFVAYDLPILVRQVRKGKFELVDSADAQASLIKQASVGSVAAANVDGKAGEEVLVAQNNFARSLVFADGKKWTVKDQYNAKSTENRISSVGFFDIGAEAKSSIFLLDGQKGKLQLLMAGEDGTYRFEKELSVGKWGSVKHQKMLQAALTGDGAANIVLFDGEKFALVKPVSQGEGVNIMEQQFIYETLIKDGIYGNVAAGDLNADGRSDIVMVEYKKNHIEILALDDDFKPTPAMRFKLFEEKAYGQSERRGKQGVEPREIEIADVTGDGREDMVTIIHDRIIIYPQD